MQELKIGRSKDNDIVIDDPSVSRYHASLFVDGNSFRIQDKDSSNGTFINGKKISGTVQMQFNDILKVGNSLVPWRNYLNRGTTKPGVTKEVPIMNFDRQTPEITIVTKKKKNYGVIIATAAILIMFGSVVAFYMFRIMSDEHKILGVWKCDGDSTEVKRIVFNDLDDKRNFTWEGSTIVEKGTWTIDDKTAIVAMTFEGKDTVTENYKYRFDGKNLVLLNNDDSESNEIQLNK